MNKAVNQMRTLPLVVMVLVSLICSSPDFAASFHVNATGSASGNGSNNSPWDIATAFAHPSSVKAGDTIWLHGGTYLINGNLTSSLAGAPGKPIIVRQFPGERAILDVGTQNNSFTIEGNISFNNGAVSTISGLSTDILVGGAKVAHNPVIQSNFTYFTISAGKGTCINLGYGAEFFACPARPCIRRRQFLTCQFSGAGPRGSIS
jgi:hypothetical protein